jgi:hypothetical protein
LSLPVTLAALVWLGLVAALQDLALRELALHELALQGVALQEQVS